MKGSVAAWPAFSVAERVPSVSLANAPSLSPCAGFEPGSECDGSCAGVVVVVVVVVVTTGGPGFGCGCGTGSPQLPERWLFSACTSTGHAASSTARCAASSIVGST